MDSISQREKDKYSDIWSIPDYAADSPGANMVDFFLSIARPKKYAAILDVGAGSGAASRKLADLGYRVSAFDLTDTAWKQDSRITFRTGSVWKNIPLVPMFDHAYCCDMMEHLPTQFVALAINNILSMATSAFFSISFSPDNFGHYLKQDLHLTVQPFQWWLDTFRELGVVEEARDMLGDGIFFVRAR